MTALVTKNLTVTLTNRTILENLSATFYPGALTVLVGPNGSGKTTLMRSLTGVNPLSSIGVLANDVEVSKLRPRQRAQLIGYLPQNREMAWDIPVRELISLGRFAYGSRTYDALSPTDRTIVDEVIEEMSLQSLSHRPLSTLSGGELSRVHFARMMAARTPIILADEPTAALDLRHQFEVMASLKNRARTGALVITALHDLDLARTWADRLIVLKLGQIVADGPPEEVLDEDLLVDVFGMKTGPCGLMPA